MRDPIPVPTSSMPDSTITDLVARIEGVLAMNRRDESCVIPRNLLLGIRARLLWELTAPAIPSTPNPELEAALDRYRDALMLPGTDVRTKSGRRLREGERESSRAALVSLYSRLQQENAALRQQFYELQQSASDEVLELKAELSKVKETALTQGEIETLYFLAFRSASVSSVTIVKLDKLRRSAVPTREAGE